MFLSIVHFEVIANLPLSTSLPASRQHHLLCLLCSMQEIRYQNGNAFTFFHYGRTAALAEREPRLRSSQGGAEPDSHWLIKLGRKFIYPRVSGSQTLCSLSQCSTPNLCQLILSANPSFSFHQFSFGAMGFFFTVLDQKRQCWYPCEVSKKKKCWTINHYTLINYANITFTFLTVGFSHF